jgi:Flp pilus assembly protein TadB
MELNERGSTTYYRAHRHHPGTTESVVETATTGELLRELAKHSRDLVKKEVALAKAEIRLDVQHEAQTAAGIGIAGFFGLTAFNLLIVAAVLALAGPLPGWAAALIVAGAMGLIAAFAAAFGWKRRVQQPLARTQRTLREDVRWAKRRVA